MPSFGKRIGTRVLSFLLMVLPKVKYEEGKKVFGQRKKDYSLSKNR